MFEKIFFQRHLSNFARRVKIRLVWRTCQKPRSSRPENEITARFKQFFWGCYIFQECEQTGVDGDYFRAISYEMAPMPNERIHVWAHVCKCAFCSVRTEVFILLLFTRLIFCASLLCMCMYSTVLNR